MKTTLFLVLGALVAIGCESGDSSVPSDPSLRGGVAGAGGAAGDAGSAAGGSTGSMGGAGGMATAVGGASGSAGACGAFQMLCNGSCIDVTTTAHCGSCTNVCGSGQSCTNSQCVGGNSGAGGAPATIQICDPASGYQITSGPCYDNAGQLQHHDGMACVMCGSLLGPGQFCRNGNGNLCVRLCSDCK